MIEAYADDFESHAVDRFSQGPELATEPLVSGKVDVFMNDVPQELRDAIVAAAGNPFTERRLFGILENLLGDAVAAGVDIGEDAASYREAYEEYGWQYDETLYEVSPGWAAGKRQSVMQRFATGLRTQLDQLVELETGEQ